MPFNKEMQRALEADGEKLRQLTGEDHGPWPRRASMSTWDDKPNDPQRSNPNIPLLERLRHFGANGMGDVSACCRDAADEIERLRGALSRLKQAFDDKRISGGVYYEDTGLWPPR